MKLVVGSIVAGVLVVGVVSSSAQSLADVARNEEARRKTIKAPSKVYTDADVEKFAPVTASAQQAATTVTALDANGAPITGNATADGLPVTGTLELREGDTARGSATLSDGSATFKLPVGLAAGSHALTASYSDSDTLEPAQGSVTVKVVPVPSRDESSMRPPSARTSAFTWARPIPSPGWSCAPERRKSSKTVGSGWRTSTWRG